MFKSLFFSSLLLGTLLLSIYVPETLADDLYHHGRGQRYYRHHGERQQYSHHERHAYERPRYCHHNVRVYEYQDGEYDYHPRRHAYYPGVNVRIGIPFPPLPPLPHHFIFRELYR